MKKKHFILLFLLVINSITFSQSSKFELGGYGEILYQHFNYGPNQRASVNGSLPDSRAQVDIPRFVLMFESHFTNDIYLEAEVEFEHLGTGSAIELEYEEFGEYEFESEKGGEVLLEEFHITKKFSDQFNLRAGRIVVSVGLLSKAHMPTQYFTTIRPESETQIIPTIWTETGLEIFGQYEALKYRLQVINGLESSGFSSERWIVEGHQSKFEFVKATNLAYALRLDYEGIPNLSFGVSGYYGNTSDNRPKPEDMEGIDAHVTIGELHTQFNNGPLAVRGMFLYGYLENSKLVSQKNSRISRNVQAPRTPVAKAATAYYVEAGYNILHLFAEDSKYNISPFGRFEYHNSMEEVEDGVFADPRFKRYVTTFGLNFFILPNLVVKVDYSIRNIGGFNSNYNNENTFGLSIGFHDWFLK